MFRYVSCSTLYVSGISEAALTTPSIALSGQLLPPELAQRLQSELQPGEILVWTGQPDPNLLARRGLIFTVFGIIFLAVPLFITAVLLLLALVSRSFLPLCIGVLLVPFFLVGAFITFTPLWNRRAAAKSLYAITNRRAIIWQRTLFSLNVRSFSPGQLGGMSRRELGNGSGDLIFYQSTYRNMDGDRRTQSDGFFALRNVHDVDSLLRATLLTSKNA